ncbi:MAG: helix-turn-helix domain-containing protein [Pseudobacter sp.]|uniref:helix-turn-helix domain-containing protein n=1 Tax=Pseudobacter sp. TaxID=2045420 RepID=UPI003F7F0F85
MRTFYIRPCPTLQPYIHSYVFLKTASQEKSLLIDQHPTGCTALAYTLGHSPETKDIKTSVQFTPKLNFTGQLKQYRPLQSGAYSAIYAVFRPIGPVHFFSQPMNRFTDQFTELSDFLPCNNIYQQLADCNSDPRSVIATMEHWLLNLFAARRHSISEKLAASTARLSGIVKKMKQVNGRNYIDDICNDFNIPQRTLEAQFRDIIGVSPKSFSRMLRINHAYRQCIVLKETDWQEIVYECNYFDQAHFIKEFKKCFGYTPAGIPAGAFNLSEQLMGYRAGKTDPVMHRLLTDTTFSSMNKKNGPAAFAADPEIFVESDYLATLA